MGAPASRLVRWLRWRASIGRSHTGDHPKADDVVAAVRLAPAARRRAYLLGRGRIPRATAQHVLIAPLARDGRHSRRRGIAVVAAPTVLNSFPNVTAGIEESKGIGWERGDRRGLLTVPGAAAVAADRMVVADVRPPPSFVIGLQPVAAFIGNAGLPLREGDLAAPDREWLIDRDLVLRAFGVCGVGVTVSRAHREASGGNHHHLWAGPAILEAGGALKPGGISKPGGEAAASGAAAGFSTAAAGTGGAFWWITR